MVCGTFHRDLSGLERDYNELLAGGVSILSPRDLNFIGERDGFVFAAHEAHRTAEEIQADHLAAVANAEFIWLHAPEGYVGVSASMEVGVAHALRIPIFGRTLPNDVTLRSFVNEAHSPTDVVDSVRGRVADTPTFGLSALQRYYGRVATLRGYDAESAQDCMLLLTEEVGELARAVRQEVGLIRDSADRDHDAAVELADLQLYLVHLANVMRIDLGRAVRKKEEMNALRAEARSVARTG